MPLNLAVSFPVRSEASFFPAAQPGNNDRTARDTAIIVILFDIILFNS